jgi:hypothetical protein
MRTTLQIDLAVNQENQVERDGGCLSLQSGNPELRHVSVGSLSLATLFIDENIFFLCPLVTWLRTMRITSEAWKRAGGTVRT